jgi:hypothetical protein
MNYESLLRKWVLHAFLSNENTYFKEVDRRLTAAGIPPERAAVFHKLALEEVQRIASGPDVLTAARNAYTAAYSKEELKGFTDFFASPLGRVYLDKGSEITQAISVVLHPRMGTTQAELDKLLAGFLRQEAPPVDAGR